MKIWHRLTAPHATDEDEARLEYTTKVILIIMIVLIGISIPLFTIAWSFGAVTPDVPLTAVLISISFICAWWLAQRKYWQLSSYIPPILMFAIALHDTYSYGIGGTNVMEYTLAILLTAILQGRHVQWGALLLSIAGSLSIEWWRIHRYPEVNLADFSYWAITTSFFYLICVFLLQFLVRQFQKSLAQTRAYALELQKYRAHLEELVQERTAQLTTINRKLTQEVAEHRRTEEALRKSEKRFRDFFENTTMGLYRTTPDGRILMANPALVKMLGYSSFEELAQRNLEEEGYPPDYGRVTFKQLVEREGRVRGLESTWTRRDNTSLHIRESAWGVRDEQGEVLYYEGTVEDITEQKRMAERLREQEKMKTRVETLHHTVATLSHYINNATAAIAGHAELCQMNAADSAELIEICLSQTKQISTVLKALDKMAQEMNVRTIAYAGSWEDKIFDIEEEVGKLITRGEK